MKWIKKMSIGSINWKLTSFNSSIDRLILLISLFLRKLKSLSLLLLFSLQLHWLIYSKFSVVWKEDSSLGKTDNTRRNSLPTHSSTLSFGHRVSPHSINITNKFLSTVEDCLNRWSTPITIMSKTFTLTLTKSASNIGLKNYLSLFTKKSSPSIPSSSKLSILWDTLMSLINFQESSNQFWSPDLQEQEKAFNLVGSIMLLLSWLPQHLIICFNSQWNPSLKKSEKIFWELLLERSQSWLSMIPTCLLNNSTGLFQLLRYWGAWLTKKESGIVKKDSGNISKILLSFAPVAHLVEAETSSHLVSQGTSIFCASQSPAIPLLQEYSSKYWMDSL